MLGVWVYDVWMITTTTKTKENITMSCNEVYGPVGQGSSNKEYLQVGTDIHQKTQDLTNEYTKAQTRKLNAEAALLEVTWEREQHRLLTEKGLHDGHWLSHPEFPVEDWIAEVQAKETRMGYGAWVSERLNG